LGGVLVQPTAGAVNTGGGGGGQSFWYADSEAELTSYAGAAGGSGTVIVRYTRAQVGG
jgi:hypothetical protein